MRRVTRIVVALGATVLFVLGGPAAAEEGEPPGRGIPADVEATLSFVVPDAVCETARGRSGERGPCAARIAAGASAARPATPSELKAAGRLRSGGGISLASFIKTTPVGTIWTRTWWQEARGLYYINWWEKHSGRIYYHGGNHVWSTTSAHGYKGFHVCDQGGGIGYDIKVTSCFTERLTTSHINEWDYWKVYVFFEGFPISASHDMRASAWGSGNIYFYW